MYKQSNSWFNGNGQKAIKVGIDHSQPTLYEEKKMVPKKYIKVENYKN